MPLAAAEPGPAVLIAFAAVSGIVLLLLAVTFLKFGFIWVKGLTSGAHVPFIHLVFMRLRGISPRLVMDVYIRLVHAGVGATTAGIQSHALAGGDPRRVAEWLAAARGAGTHPEWTKAAALDLAQELRDFADVTQRDRAEVFRRIAKEPAPAG